MVSGGLWLGHFFLPGERAVEKSPLLAGAVVIYDCIINILKTAKTLLASGVFFVFFHAMVVI